ncbi:MAG: hypothetical protein ACLFTZ_01440 [Acholeplasmataceae bacterium]
MIRILTGRALLAFFLIGFILSASLIAIDRWSILLLILALFFLVIGLLQVFLFEKRKRPKETSVSLRFEHLFLVLGVVLTYAIVTVLGVDAVVASALVGLSAAIFVKDHALAAYCGSFAGMTASALIEPVMMVLVVSILIVVYELTKGILTGFGGKSGTLALVSVFSTVILLNRDFLVVTLPQYDPILVIVVAIFGALITYVLQHRYEQNSVLASAAPSLLFALVMLPLSSLGQFYSAVFYAASFIGMSERKRLRNVYTVAFAGVVLGVLFQLMSPLFNGSGGKLGTLALVSVLVVFGFESLSSRIITRLKG